MSDDVAAQEFSSAIGPRKRSWFRLSLLVLQIAALGGLTGAVAGALAVAAWLLIFQHFQLGDLAVGAIVGAVIGAALGAALFPLAGFTMLRTIPLWRILLLTLLGTTIGGILGAQFIGTAWLLGPLTGFSVAVVWLAVRARREVRRQRNGELGPG